MPEGHTIHLLAAEHRRAFAKKYVNISSPQGRFESGAKSLSGHLLTDVRACGKNLFYHFDNDKIIHVHLGLHGHFTLQRFKNSQSPPEPRGAVRMRMMTDLAVLDLNGPIICNVIDEKARQEIIDRLGPEVLDPNADSNRAWQKISRSKVAIALLLMDQSILCGIGNAYRCELLYRQKLHPLTPGKALDQNAFDDLWKDAVHLLKMGVRRKQAWAVDETDVKNPPMIDGQPDRYNIYRRQTCRGCGSKTKELSLGGRRCFYCPKEQRIRPNSKPR